MRGRSRAVRRINRLHERIRFDKDLITTARIGVRRLQIENFIGGGVGARGKHRGVEATFCINALSGEAQLDVFRKSSATSHVWSNSGEIER